ncbi:MAG: hypothetical protein C5B50_20080 [Verrucomicrobia bacterium]|nr:MAG: hypothetical protein C5B50_20080 [Verrucomicrobiota bacterium]
MFPNVYFNLALNEANNDPAAAVSPCSGLIPATSKSPFPGRLSVWTESGSPKPRQPSRQPLRRS